MRPLSSTRYLPGGTPARFTFGGVQHVVGGVVLPAYCAAGVFHVGQFVHVANVDIGHDIRASSYTSVPACSA